MLLSVFLLLSLFLSFAQGKVECNSTAPGENGVCTGDYCFNIDDTVRGCVDFYRMIRDDNIACGYMTLFGQQSKVCICTQPYCTKYSVNNMPKLTLANVNCTVDHGHMTDTCSPGPCYVGNDLVEDQTQPIRTCWQDWFAMTKFKGMVFYEVPPLAGRPACFFDRNIFNCMCKDPGCNKMARPVAQPAATRAYFTCHKAMCRIDKDKDCDASYLGHDKCIGQMCYYLNTQYDFQLANSARIKEATVIRDCLNYSYENPIDDLTFVTGIRFGSKSSSVFYPCRGHYCNSKTSGSGAIQALKIPFRFMILSLVVLICRK